MLKTFSISCLMMLIQSCKDHVKAMCDTVFFKFILGSVHLVEHFAVLGTGVPFPI